MRRGGETAVRLDAAEGVDTNGLLRGLAPSPSFPRKRESRQAESVLIRKRAMHGPFSGAFHERFKGLLAGEGWEGSVYLITNTLTGDHFTPDFPSYSELFLVRFADSHIVEAAERVGRIIAEMMSFDHMCTRAARMQVRGCAAPSRTQRNFQKKLYDSVQAFQKGRDKPLTFHHTERPHQGCRNTERGPTTRSGS